MTQESLLFVVARTCTLLEKHLVGTLSLSPHSYLTRQSRLLLFTCWKGAGTKARRRCIGGLKSHTRHCRAGAQHSSGCHKAGTSPRPRARYRVSRRIGFTAWQDLGEL